MVPFTIAHGILGLEGIHRIGDEIDINTQTGLPRIELDRITGLHALPEADDNREANYAQGGEQVYPSLARGKTITYEGRVLGRDLWQLRALTHSLRHACAGGRLGETSFVVRPDAAIGGVSHRYDARVLALECDDEQTVGPNIMPTAYQRGFVLTVRQSDPRYYTVGADVTVPTTAAGTVVTVNNTGNAPALPVFLVNGPATTLTLHRLNNIVDRKLVYANLPAATFRADFNTRTFRAVATDADYDYLRVFGDSNWWDAGAAGLNSGATQITVEGGGTWSCTFAPASW